MASPESSRKAFFRVLALLCLVFVLLLLTTNVDQLTGLAGGTDEEYAGGCGGPLDETQPWPGDETSGEDAEYLVDEALSAEELAELAAADEQYAQEFGDDVGERMEFEEEELAGEDLSQEDWAEIQNEDALETDFGELVTTESAQAASWSDHNPLINPTHEPLGGGIGYTAIVQKSDADVLVSTYAELKEAISDANAQGDYSSQKVIYIEDGVAINMTDKRLSIKRPLILAGNRGQNGSSGPRLYTKNHNLTQNKLFWVYSRNVRFTGLRFEGPHKGQFYADNVKWFTGIYAGPTTGSGAPADNDNNANELEVDNCEFSGWSAAAVHVKDSQQVHIHHNYFHHNQRKWDGRQAKKSSQGYGVKHSGRAKTLIEGNVFTYNRHGIAATGDQGLEYQARYNFVTTGGNSHSFDVHGRCERGGANRVRCDDNDVGDMAGTFFKIDHNIFLHKGNSAFVIRGVSEKKAKVKYNKWAHRWTRGAVRQRKVSCTKNDCNYTCGDKCCCETKLSERVRFKKLKIKGNSSRYLFPGRYVSFGGNTNWFPWEMDSTPLSKLGVADLNGDGADDLVKTSGGYWYVSYSGRKPFERIKKSVYTLSNSRFGDFDGDGETDLIKSAKGKWAISRGGTGGWKNWNNSRVEVKNLAFADFDGDGTTDAFKANGSNWKVSYAAKGGWKKINNSNIKLKYLGFGDFNGDGKADVIRPTGKRWDVSWGGTGPWKKLKTSSVRLKKLAFADFDGDGTTDVMRTSGGKWYVSYSGQEPWKKLSSSSYKLSKLLIGDFNGDGKSDILRRE